MVCACICVRVSAWTHERIRVCMCVRIHIYNCGCRCIRTRNLHTSTYVYTCVEREIIRYIVKIPSPSGFWGRLEAAMPSAAAAAELQHSRVDNETGISISEPPS